MVDPLNAVVAPFAKRHHRLDELRSVDNVTTFVKEETESMQRRDPQV